MLERKKVKALVQAKIQDVEYKDKTTEKMQLKFDVTTTQTTYE